MKVALVSILFNARSGSERRTYQLAKGLIDAGHVVEIFAARVDDMDLGAKENIVPMAPGPSFLKLMSFTRNVGRMLAGRHDIDVVHNQIRPFTDGIVTVGGGCHAEYLERMRGRLRVPGPFDFLVLKMERDHYCKDGCRAVITNSEFAKAGILKHYPIPRKESSWRITVWTCPSSTLKRRVKAAPGSGPGTAMAMSPWRSSSGAGSRGRAWQQS